MGGLIGTATFEKNGLYPKFNYAKSGVDGTAITGYYVIKINSATSNYFVLKLETPRFGVIIILYTDGRSCYYYPMYGTAPSMYFNKETKKLYLNHQFHFNIEYLIHGNLDFGYLSKETSNEPEVGNNGELIIKS